jgi:hypothetical protein
MTQRTSLSAFVHPYRQSLADNLIRLDNENESKAVLMRRFMGGDQS